MTTDYCQGTIHVLRIHLNLERFCESGPTYYVISQIEERSSQLERNLNSCGKKLKSEKNSGSLNFWLDIAQLVEQCTDIAEVMGSNPVQA